MATAEVLPIANNDPATASKLEFVANRRELLAELDAVIGVVERKTTIPILANLLIQAESDGTVWITATDLDQSIKTSFHAAVSEEGSVTVPARKLYEYVKLLSGDDVNIRQQDNHWIQIRCGRSKTKMVGLSPANFPKIHFSPPEESGIRAELLRTFIEKSLIAVSTEQDRYTLNGALLVFKADAAAMIATDGRRMIHVEQSLDDTPGGNRSLFIPRKALLELLSLLKAYDGESLWFGEDDTTIYFGVGVRHLTTRKLSGKFPAWESVIPQTEGPGLMLDVATVSESLNRCLLFSEHDSRAIAFTLEETSLKLSSAAKDVGESIEEIELLRDPARALAVGFNGDYLRDFLSIVDGSVESHFKDNKSAALFTWRTDAGITLRYVLMPMKLGGNK